MQCEDAEAWGPFSVNRQVDFTPCFEESVILLLPALFIWVAAPYRISRLVQKQRNRAKTIPYALTTAYMIKMATMLLWMFASFTRIALLHQWHQAQPWLNLTGMFAAFILNHVEHVRNRIASGVLIVYWSTLFFAHGIRLRTVFDTGIPFLGLYCAITLLPLILLALECWRPTQCTYIPVSQNQHGDLIQTLINGHNLLDRITFCWVSLIIRQDIDVGDLLGDTVAQKVTEKPKWMMQANGQPFFSSLLGSYWKPLLKASSLSVIAGLLAITYPLLTLTLIRWIDADDPNPTKGVFASMSLGLVTIVQALLVQRVIFINVTAASSIQSKLQQAWDEPQPLTRAIETRLYDCRRLTKGIASFSIVWRGLVQILLVTTFLLEYLEWWNALMCMGSLVIMNALMFALEVSIQTFSRGQANQEQVMMARMEQMRANQENASLYGWEFYLKEKCKSFHRGNSTAARIRAVLLGLQTGLYLVSLPLALVTFCAAVDLPTMFAAFLAASLFQSSLNSVGHALLSILDGVRASGSLARDIIPLLTGDLVSLVVDDRDETHLLSYLQKVYPDHARIQTTLRHASIKDAIVQERPWDPVHFQKVCKACALDTTHKPYTTRKLVSLAQAAYTAADVYVLPRHFFADLAEPVQKHISKHLLEGMWKHKTRILITEIPTTEHVWYWGSVRKPSLDLHIDENVSVAQWILLIICQLGMTLTHLGWILWLGYSKVDSIGYLACVALFVLSFGHQAVSYRLGSRRYSDSIRKSLTRLISMCICVAWISIMTPFYSLLILPSAWLLMKIQSSGLDTIRRIEADRSTQHALLASAVQRRCSVLNAALASLSLLGASLLLVLHTISTTDLDRVLLGCSLLCALYLSHNLSHLDLEGWQILMNKNNTQPNVPDEEQQTNRIHLAPAEKVAVVTHRNATSAMQRRLLAPSHIAVLGHPVSPEQWAYIPSAVFGTIRETLDPLNTNPDTNLWEVLEKVHLKSRACQTDLGLDMPAHALSEHEQRNLCWARALLRRSRVLVIDESDNKVICDTDNNILRHHFADQVTLVMAQQRETVMLAHRVLIVDERGMMAGMYKPQQLLESKDLYFSFAHLYSADLHTNR